MIKFVHWKYNSLLTFYIINSFKILRIKQIHSLLNNIVFCELILHKSRCNIGKYYRLLKDFEFIPI